MSSATPAPKVQPGAGRPAPGVSSRQCQRCGEPLEGRQRRACSDACRRALNRRREAEGREARDREIRGLVSRAEGILQTALKLLGAGETG